MTFTTAGSSILTGQDTAAAVLHLVSSIIAYTPAILVQQVAFGSTSPGANSGTVTFGQGVTNGNLLVLLTASRGLATFSSAVGGGVGSYIVATSNTVNQNVYLAYGGITTGGATTLVVTYSTTDAIGYTVGEFSLVTTSVNGTTTATGSSTGPSVTGPATTAYALLVAGTMAEGSFSADPASPWHTMSSFHGTDGTHHVWCDPVYQSNGPGTYTASWTDTLNNIWGAVFAAFNGKAG